MPHEVDPREKRRPMAKVCRECRATVMVDRRRTYCPECNQNALETVRDATDSRPLEIQSKQCAWPGCTEKSTFRCNPTSACGQPYCTTHYYGGRRRKDGTPIVCWVCDAPLRRQPIYFAALIKQLLKKNPHKIGG